MSVRLLPIQFRTADYRPVHMPSVQCPRVHVIGQDGLTTQWMCVNRCTSCAFAGDIKIKMKERTGVVACAGGVK